MRDPLTSDDLTEVVHPEDGQLYRLNWYELVLWNRGYYLTAVSRMNARHTRNSK